LDWYAIIVVLSPYVILFIVYVYICYNIYLSELKKTNNAWLSYSKVGTICNNCWKCVWI